MNCGVRSFDEVHVEEDCTEIGGVHQNALFFGCKFKNLAGLTLKDCDLNRSKFLTDDIREALGFTMTIGCHSFDQVEYSPLLFDLLLTLITRTQGNDDKRSKLIDVIGKERHEQLSRIMRTLE